MQNIPNVLKQQHVLETTRLISDQQFKDFYFKRFLHPEYWYNTEAWNEYIQNPDNQLQCVSKTMQLLNVGIPMVPSLEEIGVDNIISKETDCAAEAFENILSNLKEDSDAHITFLELKPIIVQLSDAWNNMGIIVEEDTFKEAFTFILEEMGQESESTHVTEIQLKNMYRTLLEGWNTVYNQITKNNSSNDLQKTIKLQSAFKTTLENIRDGLENSYSTIDADDLKKIFEELLTAYEETETINSFSTAFVQAIQNLRDYSYASLGHLTEEVLYNTVSILKEGWEAINITSIDYETSIYALSHNIQIMKKLYNDVGKWGYYISEDDKNYISLQINRMPKFDTSIEIEGTHPFGLLKEYVENEGLKECVQSLIDFSTQDTTDEENEPINIKTLPRKILDEYFNTYWYSAEESMLLAQSFINNAIFNRVGMLVDLNIPLKNEKKATDLSTYMNTVMDISGIPEQTLDPGIYTKDGINDREIPKTIIRSVNDLYKIKTTGPTFEPKEWDTVPIKNSNRPILSSAVHEYTWKRISWFEGEQIQDKVCCVRLPHQTYPYHLVLSTQGEIIHLDINQSCNGRKLTKNACFQSKFLRTEDYIYLYFKTSVGKFTITIFGLDTDDVRLSSLDGFPTGTVLANVVF